MVGRKNSKNYHFTTQQQIMIKKNEDARLPKNVDSHERMIKAEEGSKIE